jgi:hypothetical protein
VVSCATGNELMQYFTNQSNQLRGLVRQRTILTERPLLVSEVSANFSK